MDGLIAVVSGFAGGVFLRFSYPHPFCLKRHFVYNKGIERRTAEAGRLSSMGRCSSKFSRFQQAFSSLFHIEPHSLEV